MELCSNCGCDRKLNDLIKKYEVYFDRQFIAAETDDIYILKGIICTSGDYYFLMYSDNLWISDEYVSCSCDLFQFYSLYFGGM